MLGLRRLFVWAAIIFAIVIAILGISLPGSGLRVIMLISRFFDMMLPFLAVGALINYLWKSGSSNQGC